MYKSEARSNPGAFMGRRWWKEYSGGREGRRFGKQQAHGVMRRDAVRVIHAQLASHLEPILSKKPTHQYLLSEVHSKGEICILGGASPTLKHAQKRVFERLELSARQGRLQFDRHQVIWSTRGGHWSPRLPYPTPGHLKLLECERLEIHRVQVQATGGEELRG